jgi:hypothetical protein
MKRATKRVRNDSSAGPPKSIPSAHTVNLPSFNEEDYLKANPDVALAVERGEMRSGKDHYEKYGRAEGRPTKAPIAQPRKNLQEKPAHSIDTVIVSESGAFFVLGWADDGRNPIEGLHFQIGTSSVEVSGNHLIRFRRHDAEKEIGFYAGENYGLMSLSFTEKGFLTAGVAQTEVRFVNGARSKIEINIDTESDLALREMVLDYYSRMEFFGGDAAGGKSYGDALIQFNKQITQGITRHALPGVGAPSQPQYREPLNLIKSFLCFDSEVYTHSSSASDLLSRDPWGHFLEQGRFENALVRRISAAEFAAAVGLDEDFYFAAHADVGDANVTAAEHFFNNGLKENRSVRAPRLNPMEAKFWAFFPQKTPSPFSLSVAKKLSLVSIGAPDDMASCIHYFLTKPDAIYFVDTAEMTIDQQIEYFADAEVIIAQGGAALANMLFAPRGARLVSLSSSNTLAHTFTSVTSALGQEHWMLNGVSYASRAYPYWIWSVYDFEIPQSDLDLCFDRVL